MPLSEVMPRLPGMPESTDLKAIDPSKASSKTLTSCQVHAM
tara:strand:- start:1057 stop:1179 length:123 start_codon:yes stop_codon:yes gene_type:complete